MVVDGKNPYVADTAHFNIPLPSTLKLAFYIDYDKIRSSLNIGQALQKSVEFIKPKVESIILDQPSVLEQVLDITIKYWSIFKSNPPAFQEYINLTKQ